jgi:hypothetical protein
MKRRESVDSSMVVTLVSNVMLVSYRGPIGEHRNISDVQVLFPVKMLATVHCNIDKVRKRILLLVT